ncbi:MAG: putative manganese-dependent inorganic diphosphatase [Lachnospiraceae bacterium]|nr:putative manganese-dependent inorganic diphosphatase [Lachnospiraceae bacterium]
MNTKEVIYVTGHLHPDTDSIASAIAYAFFKRAMGTRAVPCRLGKLNSESEYLLDRFGFDPPMLLRDARVTLSEIQLDPLNYIHPETTILECLHMMKETGKTYCGVVDEEMHLVGLVTKSDIAEVGLGDTSYNNDILRGTSVENIRKTLDGRIVYECSETHTNGRVSVAPMSDMERLGSHSFRDRIVIIGNDMEAQKRVISAGAGMLIAVWTEEIDSSVTELAEQYRCPIIISGHGATNTSRYIYFSPSVNRIMKTDLIKFRDYELAEDVGVKMMRSRYHIYPVVDQEDKLKGYVARYHIMNSENKQIVMVDHNEFAQSVRAVNEARILEVIDHHRINDFSSTQPVAFRNEIVGSTATIVAKIFRENQIPIPANMAGLLLGAVLSDTMNFLSPTTTDKDRNTANILAALADLDIEEFANDLFAVSSNTAGKTLSEMIGQDIKFYEIRGCRISVSQVMVTSASERASESAGIQPVVEAYVNKKQLDLAVVVFTSIVENGSVVFGAGKRASWVQEAFPDREGEEHSLQEGLLSRKQQILPMITKVVERYL